MKNIINTSFLLICTLLFLTACSSDDSNSVEELKKFSIVVKGQDKSGTLTDYSSFTYSVYNQNTSESIKGNLDQKGLATIELQVGNYDFNLESPEIGFGFLGNVSINKSESIVIDIELVKPTYQGLIISELFTSGEGAEDEYGEYVELADQYVVIYNNSDKVKYLDGLSYGITEHWNKFPYNATTQQAMDEKSVLAAIVYTFPGTGTDYPIAPGQEVVLARSARDFSEKGKNKAAADLSGADFEIVMPSNDTDNPKVPNMIVNGTTHADMLGYGVGYSPAFLFRQQGDLKSFLSENSIVVESMYGSKPVFKIPVDIIVDGVETGQVNQVKYKSLLNEIDRGYVTVSDTGTREVYVRRIKQNQSSRKVYMDTNNSSEDFEIRVGQRNFPAK
ncbi:MULTISPECIES: DUF4876 domain-containing protein [Myroides]|uniref:DUF4876 domain-containing protein n=1 Tax=Myroides albus TaxID=2562892 RepID=A0A6I3LGP1_9FLAO|nr:MULTISPECIES: DUF4876 domain-containing protein [Myroides]MTG98719.1 DUF4876 domain-containing protein [Myroides albus]MVX36849.1 DUF4876 domain-containing protein [Myroides sp. LoEW2-1]UVD79082.1 DUF4876 domain-containing protein [Myroides albus]